MKILLVDDDEGTRVTLGYALSQAGLKVRTVSDARQALRVLRKACFDWMVTDGDMVPVTGFDLAETAHKLQPRMAIVMISGVFTAGDNPGPPILRIFQKPVDAGQLVAFLKSAAHKAAGWPS